MIGKVSKGDAKAVTGWTSRRTMIRGIAAGAVMSAVAKPFLPANAEQAASATTVNQQVYFGWLLGSAELAAVALDVRAAETEGAVDVRAYVCDGLGLPAGMAVWFRAAVDHATVDRYETAVTLTSPTGKEAFTVGHLNAHAALGTFTDAEGRIRKYAAFVATGGAGIYDVTLDENLRYNGTSTDGAVLAAQADEAGNVEGTITTTDGQEIAFHIKAMTMALPERLAELGLPISYMEYAENSVVPVSYVALLSPGGYFWLGRSGDIRAGSPGTNIIGLDMLD